MFSRTHIHQTILRMRGWEHGVFEGVIFEEIARGREEASFRQKEAELIDELRRRFHQQQDRERLAEEVGVHDEHDYQDVRRTGILS